MYTCCCWYFVLLQNIYVFKYVPVYYGLANLFVSGNYKVQAYDTKVKDYLPVAPGIGMHVEIKDPDDKIVLSRVSLTGNFHTGYFFNFLFSCFWG